ncbi:hypothetical protein CJF30_00010352 [Rutstroemia sp. NJR-2017a BBW]|nr:hypothetical protein CJF30_00010352 [Rutstroemia sp. NJR-2017a BBW]
MGKNTKRVQEFIDGIPDSKLTALPSSAGTIYTTTDFRLDMQGLTSGDPQKHNLQIQINKQTTITSLKKSAPQTVATLLVLKNDAPSAATIKQDLTTNIII